MPGGFLALTIDPTQPAAGVLFASVPRCRRVPDDGDFRLNECSMKLCHPDSAACFNQFFGMLRAFDPTNLRELWNNQDDLNAPPDDKAYIFAKFVPPTIAHGRVFLATASRGVLVYGLKPP
jgi:hypothetical protein